MGGIFQGDALIKMCVELGIDDMRKNDWLLDHVFESLKTNPFLSDKYGQKNIDSAKEWFANNQIDIYMRPRNDEDRMPCIIIYPGASEEVSEYKTMADTSTETITLQPSQIGKQIAYVVKPFTPEGYLEDSGEVFVPMGLIGFDAVSPGMVLVDPSTGNGYKILDVTADSIFIEPNQNLETSQLAIIPQYPYFKANIEHTWHHESYTIESHAHGDPQVALWLHSIVLYSLYRYREGLLEANGLMESVFRNGELLENPAYEGPNGEQAFYRSIIISCTTEQTWIKAPRRFIESASLKDGSVGGVKILSNLDSPQTLDKTQENWYTDAENENDPDDPEDQNE